MSSFTILLLFIGISIGLAVLIKMPLAFSIGIGALTIYWLNDLPISSFATGAFSSINSFSFLAIPFFIFAGTLMQYSGISQSLLKVIEAFFGRIKGSLGSMVIIGSMAFGALSGSAMATITAIGKMLAPQLVSKGYNKKYVTALIASTCYLGILIPPSIPGIIYALSSGTSVADVWLATIPAAIILGVLYYCINLYMSKNVVAEESKISFKEFSKNIAIKTKDGLPALFMPIIIFGGIYGGIFTPTEAGAVSAVYGLLYFIIRKYLFKSKGRINENIWGVTKESAIFTGVIVIIIVFASLAGRAITLSGVSQSLADLVTNYVDSPIAFLLIINILFLFLGTFMDMNTSILIMTPLLMPTVELYGIDPVHFGAIVLLNLSIGFITPPFAASIFISCKIVNTKFEEVVKYILPFLAASLISLVIVTYIPEFSLFLTKLLE